jgi:hypothetical protein
MANGTKVIREEIDQKASIKNLRENAMSATSHETLLVEISRISSILMILFLLLSGIGVDPLNAAPLNPTMKAVVLINSTSADYEDFQHFIQPYLDNFGIPYDVQNLAVTPVGPEIEDYSLIIIGHRDINANGQLNSDAQTYLTNAVVDGSGLVNFDNALSSGTSASLQFVQDLFGFTYDASTHTASGVAFDTSHYITQLHTQDTGPIATGSMTLAGITGATGGTRLAWSASNSNWWLAASTNYRAVQFGTYDWMSVAVKGPVFGLDDTVWRSLVWAARKPFVMQGIPPLATMRADDVAGPLDWVHIANEVGLKPWLGLFIDDFTANPNRITDLRGLVDGGNATATIHAFNSGTFFYANPPSSNEDPPGGTNWPDSVMAASFQTVTDWFASNHIRIGKWTLGHWYATGSNEFGPLDGYPNSGLLNWGGEFIGLPQVPGHTTASTWLQLGPYRLYETGRADAMFVPHYYADYLPIPGHPELDGKIFNCFTELRDIDSVNGYDWKPTSSDLAGSIAQGTLWFTRSFNSMTLATLFIHEYGRANIVNTAADWRTILQAIAANIARYHPRYVTMDYGCQYLRAMHDSNISDGAYNAVTKLVTVDLSGKADMPTQFYLFTDDSGAIRQSFVDVPAFNGSTQVVYTIPGPLDHVDITPNPASVVAGASQQFTATAKDAADNPISDPDLSFSWSVVNGGGTINSSGVFTASLTIAAFADTVAATTNGKTGYATVTVTEPVLDHFTINAIASPQYGGLPIQLTIYARDAGGNIVLTYAGRMELTASAGTLTPALTGSFVNGRWTGTVTIAQSGVGISITAADEPSGKQVTSNTFNINTSPSCPCSIWPSNPTPANPHGTGDASACELAVRFRSDIPGYVTGLRFYKDPINTGTHTGHLWSVNGATGDLLGTLTFTNETAIGWQTAYFASPIYITANATYVASYLAPNGGYAADRPNYFTASGVDTPPLHALRSGVDGPNASYAYQPPRGEGGFPGTPADDPNYWVDLVFDPTYTPDTTPPVVQAVTPLDGAADVAVSTNVTATFSEPVQAASISASTFELRDGFNNLVPGAVTYDAGQRKATLAPNAPLVASTTYTAKLISGASGVKDLAGNPLAVDFSWSFTTTMEGALGDDTVADFSAGNHSCAYISQADDGELMLAPTAGAEFDGSSLPSGWVGSPWGTGGSYQVGGGKITLDHATVYANTLYTAGHSIEFVATFTSQLGEHVGLGYTWSGDNWAIFSTGPTGTPSVKARCSLAGVETNTDLGPSYVGSPHRYRIDWSANRIDYFIDGIQVVTHNVSIPGNMRPSASDYGLDTAPLTVDWMRMSPYAGPCTFESRVFDAGATVNWRTLSWTAAVPSGTTLAFGYRVGNTSAPDPAWSPFVAVPVSGNPFSAGGRHAQYRVTLNTANSFFTPNVQDVLLTYGNQPDTTAPFILSRVPDANGTDVPVNSTVTVSFSEALASASVNGATVYLRRSGDASDVTATVTLADNVVTLDPCALLEPGTVYTVTVKSSIADLSGNLLGADAVWSFTSASVSGHFTDTTVADFNAGATGSNTYVSQMSDGEVILQPTVGAEFSGSSLPAGWAALEDQGDTGHAVTVANGALTVNGYRVGTTATYGAGRSLEYVAAYNGTPNSAQLIGFGVDWHGIPWAIIDTNYPDNTGMRTRRNWNNSWEPTAVPGTWFDGPHRYRIEWASSTIKYYFDGTLIDTDDWGGTTEMRPMVLEASGTGPGSLTVDWMHMSPYASSGQFTSRVMNGGQPVHWTGLTWVGSTPTGTSVSFETRTGDVATPDSSWSAWQAVGGPVASPDGQYIQYRATLSTADSTQTPTIGSVDVTYNGNAYSPTISGNAGVAGATLSYMDCTQTSATANSSGDYSVTVSHNWSGTVTPSKAGYSVTPASRTYSNLVADVGGQDYTVTLNAYALSIIKTGAGSGTVTSEPTGIDCGATCSYSFDYNTIVTLTATAAGGSRFVGWSGAGCSGTGSCLLTVDIAKSVTAEFSVCSAEVCNGLDDDCDGAIDEGDPEGGAACPTGQPGVCAAGTKHCVAGELSCVPNTPSSTETCNGLDDDCDGQVDDELTATITVPSGLVGIPGQVISVPVLVSDVTGMGAYSADVEVTFDSTVLAAQSVSPGVALTGKNCEMTPNLTLPGRALITVFCTKPLVGGDPLLDISFTVATLQYGRTTPLTLAKAKLNETCPVVTAQSGGFTVRGPEICDGQDNDGNGQTDEGLGQTTCGLGICVHTIDNCLGGVPQTCNPLQGAAPETCNGLDDDCDGSVDEDGASLCNDGDVCTADACTSGECVHSGICGVSGAVLYYRDGVSETEPSVKPVPNVGIGGSPTGQALGTTDVAGAYLVGGLHGDVTITPVNKYGVPRASDHNGAITSLDASRVAFAAVGNVSLSAGQILAGDVTGNGTLSALDASYVARFSAELVNHFPVAMTAGSDWKFVKCEPSYPDNCVAPIYDFPALSQSETGKNFFAILYGEVTGNWERAGGRFAAASGRTSTEERAAMARDQEVAEQFRREGVPHEIERSAASPPAELSLSGWKALRAGEPRQVTVRLRNADGILGLDLRLEYDSSRLAIVGVQATGIGSGLSLARSDQEGTYRIAAYGVVPLSGSGPLLTVTVEALRDTGRRDAPTIGGVANEGAIRLLVREERQAPSTRR